MKLVGHLIKSNIPHNVFITRGSSLEGKEDSDSSAKVYDVTRVCIWARETTVGTFVILPRVQNRCLQ